MNTAELCEVLTNAAWRFLELGYTPDRVRTWAKQQDKEGCIPNAEYMRCVAGIMESFLETAQLGATRLPETIERVTTKREGE